MNNPFHVTAQRNKFTLGDVVYLKRSTQDSRNPGTGVPAGTAMNVTYSRSVPQYDLANNSLGYRVDRVPEDQLTKTRPQFKIGDNVSLGGTSRYTVKKIIEFSDQYRQWRYEIEDASGQTTTATEGSLSYVANPMQQFLPTGHPQQVTFNYGDRVRVRTNTGKISPNPTAAYAGEEGEIVSTGSGPHYQVKFDQQIGRLNQLQSIHGDDLELVQATKPQQKVPFKEGDKVHITGGSLAGQTGVIAPKGFGAQPYPVRYNVKLDNPPAGVNRYQSVDEDDLELWQPSDSQQQVAPQTEDRKSQVADRIYDITLSGKPEDHEGELQELFAEWKQMTGRDKPRFLEGRKIKAQPTGPAHSPVADYTIGQDVMTASGKGTVTRGWWDKNNNDWMYEIDIPGYGSVTRTQKVLNKHKQSQSQGMSAGDIVYLTKSIGPPHRLGDEFEVIAPYVKSQYEVRPMAGGPRTFIDASKLTKDKPKFGVGDQVQIGGHTAEVKGYYDYEIAGGSSLGGWSYDVEFTSGPYAGHPGNNVDERSMKPVGAQAGTANQARFKRGDTAWVARPLSKIRSTRSKGLTDGEEVAIVSDPQSRTNGEIEYYVQKPGQSSQLWPDKWLHDKAPKYSIGDSLTDWSGASGAVGDILWDERNKAWTYEIDLDDGGTELIREDEVQSSNRKSKPKAKPQKKKFKPGDRVKMIDESKSHQSLQGMVYTVDREEGPSADHKDTLYRVKDSSGRGWYATSAEMEHVGQQQPEPQEQTQQEQHDTRQKVDPDQQPRQTFHPSQQELMSHIKDKGTPYFPPTPEGQKAFEEYLIKQHNDFYEDLKRNWSMLIKKHGKKGQLMVRKQKDALYVHAMKYAKKD